MKWIGQHVWDFISRFRGDVYLENIADHGSDPDRFLTMDSTTGKVSYRTGSEVSSDRGAGATDLSVTANGTSLTVESSSGSNVALPAATNSAWGIMSDDHVVALEANTAKATNVATNLTASTHVSQITINSSDGDNVVIAEASGSIAGVMTVAHHDKLDGIEASATADQTKSDIDGLAITTVGTIDTGTWQGTTIKTAYIGDDQVTEDKLANTLLAEIDANTAKTSFSNLTGEVTSSGAATTIADNIVDEANLKVSNAPTNGYFLSAQSGDTGGLTWAAASGSGDITSVVAGAGMTGGATSGDATLNVIGGDGITANADDIAVTAAQTTITSISNAGLKVGRDQHNLIDFGTTDNRIFFRASDADQIVLLDGALLPVLSNDIDLGSDALEFKDAWFDGTLEADAITIGGTAIASVLSPVAGHASIATVGTIGTGTWQGTAVASAYLDADTAHLSGTQTFSGAKTFSELIAPTKGHLYAKGSDTHFEAQGDIIKIGTGSTTAGELCYLKADGTWAATNADAVATSGGVLLAMALGADPDADGMLLRGMFTTDGIDGTEAVGDELYVSVTAGNITRDAPTGSADIVRVVGYCLDGTDGQIWFNPSDDWVVVA